MCPGLTTGAVLGENKLTATGVNPQTPQKRKKPDTKAYILYNPMYVKQPEKEKFRDREFGDLDGD